MSCPNCKSDKITELKDNKLLCSACNTVFKLERDGVKVDKPDALDDIDRRLTNLEKKQAGPAQPPADGNAEPEPGPAPDDSDEPDDDDDEDSAEDNLFAR